MPVRMREHTYHCLQIVLRQAGRQAIDADEALVSIRCRGIERVDDQPARLALALHRDRVLEVVAERVGRRLE